MQSPDKPIGFKPIPIDCTTVSTIRNVPPKVKAKLLAEAKSKKWSVNTLLVDLLTKHVEKAK